MFDRAAKTLETNPIGAEIRPEPACRPFHLSDALILVAASAIWAAQVAAMVPAGGTVRQEVFPATLTALEVASLAYFVLRFRKPRLPWPSFRRQPGLVSVPSAIGATLTAGMMATLSRVPLVILAPIVGLGFGVAWLVLVDAGLIRPQPGWIERLGQIVTFAWVGLFLLGSPLWLILLS